MTKDDVIKAVQQGRAQLIDASGAVFTRQNDKRPATMKTYIPDPWVNNMNGLQKLRGKIVVLWIEPEPLIVAPGLMVLVNGVSDYDA